MLFRDASNTLRTVAGIKFRDAGNVLRTVSGIAFRDAGNVLRSNAGVGLSAVVDTSVASGFGASFSSISITTTTVTATVSGGTPPYSHSWIPVDLAWSAVNPGSATTSFRSPLLASGDSQSTDFVDTITDANGATTTVTVSASGTNFGIY